MIISIYIINREIIDHILFPVMSCRQTCHLIDIIIPKHPISIDNKYIILTYKVQGATDKYMPVYQFFSCRISLISQMKLNNNVFTHNIMMY